MQNWLRCEDDTCCAFRTRQTPLEVLHKRHTCTSCNKSDLITEVTNDRFDFSQFIYHSLFSMMIVNWICNFASLNSCSILILTSNQSIERKLVGRIFQVKASWQVSFSYRANRHLFEKFTCGYDASDFQNNEWPARTYWSYCTKKWLCWSMC